MNNLEKIRFIIKREMYQVVEISEETGYNKFDSIAEVCNMIDEIKNKPIEFAEGDKWEYGETVIDGDIEFVETK